MGSRAVQGFRETNRRVVELPRILHVDSGRSWRGGQRQVFLLATGLRDLGYRTLVVAPTGSPPQGKRPRNWRRERGWPPSAVICGVVGAMTQEKGLDMVGGIARRLPGELFRRTRLVLLGGKGKGGTTVSGVESFDAGFVEEIHDAVSGLDVLWHPARSEGLGTSVIDAMALGVPPIAFAVGGLPELIEDGKSGLLVSPGDLTAFVRAAAALITDDGLRAMLAEGAKLRGRHFAAGRMVGRDARGVKGVLTG